MTERSGWPCDYPSRSLTFLVTTPSIRNSLVRRACCRRSGSPTPRVYPSRQWRQPSRYADGLITEQDFAHRRRPGGLRLRSAAEWQPRKPHGLEWPYFECC